MLDPPVKMKPFEAKPPSSDELKVFVKQLEDAVKMVDFPGGCHGFVIDGDMAAELEGYFTSREIGERSVGMFSDAGESN